MTPRALAAAGAALLAVPRRPLLVLAAGPGWRDDCLPAGVVRPVDLTEAVSLALAVRDSLDQSSPHAPPSG